METLSEYVSRTQNITLPINNKIWNKMIPAFLNRNLINIVNGTPSNSYNVDGCICMDKNTGNVFVKINKRYDLVDNFYDKIILKSPIPITYLYNVANGITPLILPDNIGKMEITMKGGGGYGFSAGGGSGYQYTFIMIPNNANYSYQIGKGGSKNERQEEIDDDIKFYVYGYGYPTILYENGKPIVTVNGGHPSDGPDGGDGMSGGSGGDQGNNIYGLLKTFADIKPEPGKSFNNNEVTYYPSTNGNGGGANGGNNININGQNGDGGAIGGNGGDGYIMITYFFK